jgi:hypothetical protein
MFDYNIDRAGVDADGISIISIFLMRFAKPAERRLFMRRLDLACVGAAFGDEVSKWTWTYRWFWLRQPR